MKAPDRRSPLLSLVSVRVHLSLASKSGSGGNVDETSVVKDTLVCSSLRLLWLLLLLNLWSLGLNLTSSRKTSVDFTHCVSVVCCLVCTERVLRPKYDPELKVTY